MRTDCEDELRQLRDRVADLEDLLDRLEGEGNDGAACVVGTSFAQSSYPGSAGMFYAFHRTSVTGTETEGSTPTLTTDADVILAANLGTAVPPSGTAIPLDRVPHRWVFRHDG